MGENYNKNKLTNGEQSNVDSPNPPAIEKLIPDFESFDDYVKVNKIIFFSTCLRLRIF